MSGLPEPQPGLPFGTTNDDVNALWAADCPMCRGKGSVLARDEELDLPRRWIPCPNCGGSGGAEIPF